MTFEDYYMRIAEVVKLKSGCTRRQVGAVFVVDNRIASVGYNQAPSGINHCSKAGCTLQNGHCIRSIHAELNGILNATKVGQSLEDSVVYVTTYPCFRCMMALRNAGIKKIFFRELYSTPLTREEQQIAREVLNHFVVEKI